MYGFDIETAPRDDLPIPPREPFPEFIESEVKTGNAKRPEKIKEIVDKAREKWFKDKAAYEAMSEESWAEEARDGWGLCASTGKVLAVGIWDDQAEKFICLMEETEEATLIRFWNFYRHVAGAKHRHVTGWNINQFDLPFLVRRSWANNLEIPGSLYSFSGKWMNWNPLFVDASQFYLLGSHPALTPWKFDIVAQVMGTSLKPDGVEGKHWWKTVREDREAAMRYLENDCRSPVNWLKKMQPSYASL